jgi:hypothetical protein
MLTLLDVPMSGEHWRRDSASGMTMLFRVFMVTRSRRSIPSALVHFFRANLADDYFLMK